MRLAIRTIGALATAVALLFALWLRSPLMWLVVVAVFLGSFVLANRFGMRK